MVEPGESIRTNKFNGSFVPAPIDSFFLALGPVRARRIADRKEDTVIKRSSFRFIIALWRDRAACIRFQVGPQRTGGSRFPARLRFSRATCFST